MKACHKQYLFALIGYMPWECNSVCIHYSTAYSSRDVGSVHVAFHKCISAVLCPQANRWRKRGLGVVPLKFSIEWDGIQYTVFVSIYSEDGTVAIAHAGIEIGQGINTKVSTCRVRAECNELALNVYGCCVC